MAFPFRGDAFARKPEGRLTQRLWSWLRSSRRAPAAPPALGVRVDALEPRFLLSADLMPFTVDLATHAAQDYALRYDNLVQSVQLLDRATGQVLDQRQAQQIDAIRVLGTSGDDRLTIDFAAQFLTPLDITFEGGAGVDALSMSGGTVDSVSLAVISAGTGEVTISMGEAAPHRIAFSGVALVQDTLGAAQRIFADATGLGQVLRLMERGAAGDGLAAIEIGDGLLRQEFGAPVGLLAIEGGLGDDTLTHLGLEAQLDGKVVFQGGAGTDAVIGPPQDADWHVTGLNAGHVAGVSFVSVERLLGTADNEDTFFVHGAAAISGVMDGGAGGFDSLVLEGGTFTSVAYVATGPTSGTITRDGVTLVYDGLEPITDNMSTTDRVIDLSEVSDTATLSQSGANYTVASTDPLGAITFESVTFTKPSNSLTIRFGEDEGIPILSRDQLTIGTVDLSGIDLIIDGQDGTDKLIVTGILTVRDLTVTVEDTRVSGTILADDITITAAAGGDAAGDGEITGGAIFAAAATMIDLTGATVTATGAVTLSATSTANIVQSQFTENGVPGGEKVGHWSGGVMLSRAA